MSRTLTFSLAKPLDSSRSKNDSPAERQSRRLVVDTTVLPTGERLPLLINWSTGLPLSLAMRWVLFGRRHHAEAKTTRGNLGHLRSLYLWGDARFPEGLEARLTAGPLTTDELLSLRQYVETGGHVVVGQIGDPEFAGSPATIGSRALAIKQFLEWMLSPASRNDRGAPPEDWARDSAQIQAVFGPWAKRAGESAERIVVSDTQLDIIERLIEPVRTPDGRFLQPLQWHPDNPFRRASRIRNWLMWCLARECGLRIGEILCLRANDTAQIGGETHVVVRDERDRPDDTRRNAPSPKTRARTVPLVGNGAFALTAYQRAGEKAGGRKRGTPYLISARTRNPLSERSAGKVIELLAQISNVPISWHDLRHAWATDIARGVLGGVLTEADGTPRDPAAVRALLVEQLRLLGGWSEQSTMPMYYARVAIKEDADRLLAARQRERAAQLGAYENARTPLGSLTDDEVTSL